MLQNAEKNKNSEYAIEYAKHKMKGSYQNKNHQIFSSKRQVIKNNKITDKVWR